MVARNTSLAFAVAALAVCSTTAHAADDKDVVLEPTGAWQLDMADDKCRIARLFGSGSDQTLFFLEQWDPANTAEWLVAGPALKSFSENRETIYTFGPDGRSDAVNPPAATLAGFGEAFRVRSSLTPLATDAMTEEERQAQPRGLPALDDGSANGVTRLSLTQGKRKMTLNLGSMKEPVAAMNTCMRDLVGHWGLDPVQQETIVKGPELLNARSVVEEIMSTYPRRAERKGAQADYKLRLMVSADGSVSKCTLLNTTLAADFEANDHPCTVFSNRAKFAPAVDAAGKTLPSYYTQNIRYRIY